MKSLTARQELVLTWICQFIGKNGYPPTRPEIAHGLGFSSPNAAQDHLVALERKGAVTLTRGVARGIAVKRLQQATA